MDSDFPPVGRFRKKPVVIEARQWDGTAPGATAIIDWVLAGGGTARYTCTGVPCPATDAAHDLAIDTLEGTMRAKAGDWIIRGIEGEHYPCDDLIFRGSYEHVFGDLDHAP